MLEKPGRSAQFPQKTHILEGGFHNDLSLCMVQGRASDDTEFICERTADGIVAGAKAAEVGEDDDCMFKADDIRPKGE